MAKGVPEEEAGKDAVADAAGVLSYADLLGKLDEEERVEADQSRLVVDQDTIDAETASYSVDQLLLRAGPGVARAVALFGPGIVALPVFGRVAGVEDARCLAYDDHPARASSGVMDRLDLETKFGSLDPQALIEELLGGERQLAKRLRQTKSEDIRKDILYLQEWRKKVKGRMRTLERRAAWAVLGIPYTQDQATIRRAFKRRALELHPDKGGNAERFQLLQDMRDSLILPKHNEPDGDVEDEEDVGSKESGAGKNDGPEEGGPPGGPLGKEGPSGVVFEGDLEEVERLFQEAKAKEETEAEDCLGDDAKHPDRPKLEAARKKIHLSLVDAWHRTTKLATEIQNPEGADGISSSSGGAIRALRRFIDRFAAMELSQLREADQRKAERVFRRFLEQGSEVLCAAGALDPQAAVAEVATKVNCQILSVAPASTELKQRCARLLEALRSLPQTFDRFVAPMELQLAAGAEDAEEAERPGPPEQPVTPCSDQAQASHNDDHDLLTKAAEASAEAALGGKDAKLRPKEASKDAERMEAERRRRFLEESRREQQALRSAAEARRKAQEMLERREAEEEEARSHDLVPAQDEKDMPGSIQRVRTEWDGFWEHSCAGEKRSDGSAIFCEPCDCWITIPPFDHTAFELHVEKAGHTDWID